METVDDSMKPEKSSEEPSTNSLIEDVSNNTICPSNIKKESEDNLNLSCEVASIDHSSIKEESKDSNTLVSNAECVSSEDPYAYINRNGFTSEKFKIEVRGLPKFYGIGELKKLFNTKLKLGMNKIKPPKARSHWVYVCFRSEEDREEALKVIDGLKWKGSTLSAVVAKPAPDPLVKRRNEAQWESNKKQKLDDTRTQDEKLKDSAVPFWRHSQEKQIEEKTKNIKKTLRNMVYDIERQNHKLKVFFQSQRDKNEGIPLLMNPLLMSQSADGYRNKCEFTIGIDEETGEKTVGMRLGSYATGTLGVGPIYNMPHIPNLMKEAVKVFEGYVRSSPLDVFNPETYTGYWRQLTVRLGCNTQQLMLIVGVHPQQWTQQESETFRKQLVEFFSTGEGKSLNLTSLYYQEITKRQSGEQNPVQLVMGESHIQEILCDLRFNISALSFFQVNTAAAELLYAEVGRLAQLTQETTLVDVCCGTGSIGLSLAKDCGQVLGLELMEQAVADARQNATNNSVANCEFFSGPAEDILQSVVDKAKFDNVVAVVDPPRAGLRQNAVVMLRRISKIKKIAYISCHLKSAVKNIVDLARPQSKTLAGAPFVPVAVTPVDLFPYTDHCEVVIYLERLESYE